MMYDLRTLASLIQWQPSNAAEVPKCSLCGENPAPNVCHGTFPDGEKAGYVPVCSTCFEAKKAPPETDKS